jgi:hypothetical protein
MTESIFTCEHCDDGLATETLATTGEKVCPDCLEFLKSCDEDKRELRACDCGNGQHKMIKCLDCDDVLERDCEAGVLR